MAKGLPALAKQPRRCYHQQNPSPQDLSFSLRKGFGQGGGTGHSFQDLTGPPEAVRLETNFYDF
jgi:hypothetical protein